MRRERHITRVPLSPNGLAGTAPLSLSRREEAEEITKKHTRPCKQRGRRTPSEHTAGSPATESRIITIEREKVTRRHQTQHKRARSPPFGPCVVLNGEHRDLLSNLVQD